MGYFLSVLVFFCGFFDFWGFCFFDIFSSMQYGEMRNKQASG